MVSFNKLSWAVAVAIATMGMGTGYAAPNITVGKLLERAQTSPASMCLTFSGSEQVASSTENLQQFLSLTKAQGTAVPLNATVSQGMLCLSGLEHGQSYQLGLKKGLSFVSGATLSEDVTVPFTVSDALAQIKLPYNIVLPRNGQDQSFAIETVNQGAFKLAIYKLSARSLNQLNISSLLHGELNGWRLTQLLDSNAHKVYERIFNLADHSVIDLSTYSSEVLEQAGITMPVGPQPRTDELQTSDDAGAELATLQAALRAQLSPESRNKPIATTIALKDFVSEHDDGMYLVVASDPRLAYEPGNAFYNNSALPLTAKLMMLTDLGLSTYRSPEGILVNVRALSSAKTLAGIKLELVAANNEILATTTTDEQGVGRFGPEVISGTMGLTPRAIVASGEHDGKFDIYSLDLNSSPLYLEDNQGIYVNDKFETFAYTERGIYREGETVHYTALVRDSELQAQNLPLTLQVLGKYNNELDRTLLTEGKDGGYEYDFVLPEGTPHGTYRFELKLGSKVIASTPFTVGVFVPQQINSTYLTTDTYLPQGKEVAVKTQTNFNYGGAASNLAGMVTVTTMPDDAPIPAVANAASNAHLSDFHFGPDQRNLGELTKNQQYHDLKTNVEGVLSANITLPNEAYPQKAKVNTTIYDSNGQALNLAHDYKVSFNRPVIGVRLLDATTQDSGVTLAPSSGRQNFALCSYLQDGSTYPQDVKYYLYKEFVDYNFVYENNQWQFVRFTSRNLVNSGSVRVDNKDLERALISAELADGSYVLELESDKSKTAFSFVKGFLSSDSAFTPDRIALYADKKQYEVGDTVKLTFESPFAGYANLALGNQGIADFKTFEVKQGVNEVEFKLNQEYYPQGHALLSIFAPLSDQASAVNTVRAVGLVDLNLNLDRHKLAVTTQVPDTVKPGSTLSVNVTAQGLAQAPAATADAAQEAYVEAVMDADDSDNLAPYGYAKITLVDNGVLALTGYRAPDPNSTLMQDRRYNVSLYDAYGLLMRDPMQQGQGYGATMEKMMADAAGAAPALETLPFKTVALASEIVPLNSQGKASVDFKLPQFSGSLKVMAVAWDKERTGATSQDVVVADNAVASLGLPRFLNVGDKVNARLNLHNLKAQHPDFKIDLSCSGAIKCSQQLVSSLKPGQRADENFTIESGDQQGVGKIKLTVLNPDYNFTQDYEIAVTYPQLPMLKNYLSLQQPGTESAVKLNTEFKGVNAVMVAKSLLPNVNPEAYTAQMERFGYYSIGDLLASLESKLLYGKLLIAPKDQTADNNDSADNSNNAEQAKIKVPEPQPQQYQSEAELNAAIQDLIFRIVARQTGSGNFAGANPYFNCYAADMLLLAEQQGFSVNATALDGILSYLRNLTSDFNAYGVAAYANEILARYESINQANVRYAADEKKLQAPLQLAHLANALNQIGDKARAETVIEQAIAGLLTWQQLEDKLSKLPPTAPENERYQLLSDISTFNTVNETDLRHDAFIVLDACLRLGLDEQVVGLINKLNCLQEVPDYLSHLTMAAMLRANNHVAEQESDDLGSVMLSKDDIALLTSGQGQVTGKGYSIDAGTLKVKNEGQSPVFITTTVLGQHIHDSVIANNGINVNVNYFNREGKIDPSSYQFALNEEILMEVNYSQELATRSNTMVKVKLPAGFEYVRRATYTDPSYGSLIPEELRYNNPDELTVSDDMVVARYYAYDKNSLFLVLRAAHEGTFTQGEALVQLQSNPQAYGSYTGQNSLTIQGLKAPKVVKGKSAAN